MQKLVYWADRYEKIKCSSAQAVSLIKSGQRVFIGSTCGEPQHLVRELCEASTNFTDLEIVRLLSLETTPLTLIAHKTQGQNMNIRSFYLGSSEVPGIVSNMQYITPINLSAVPRLFINRSLPIHVALVQLSPPDAFGWMSLGISVDITMAAAMSADLVIAQVNNKMPRVLGRSAIHVNDVDAIVEYEENLLVVDEPRITESADLIGRHIARLIDDGSTITVGIGAVPHATLYALSDKNDLGVHTQYLTNGIMHLVSKGVITNREKGFNEGRLVASSAIGTNRLYEFLDDNPAVEFHPSDYVNDPGIISRHNKMVSMHVAMAVDLTGQVASDAISYDYFSGINGMLDFMRGAAQSKGGKSIIMLPATSMHGKKSRIVPKLHDIAVVVPRGDVQYVVTEYGAVNLFGKSFQERAMAMISIAHPDFRDELFSEAQEIGLLGPERTLTESIHGVYPLDLEETMDIQGECITFRPAKPVDERIIQEHFYSLDKDDVISRFFHRKTTFLQDEVGGMSQIDYIKNLTILAVVGEFGFEKVVAIGEYLLDEAKNIAEVAFSVNKKYQRKGMGRILLHKLASAARERGIAGFIAYTSPQNKGMIRLFQSLPYKETTFFDGDMLSLTCKFDQLK